MTEAQYLTVEETAREKSEYIYGRAYAMSGVSFGHDTIALNLAYLLRQPAKLCGCRIFSGEVKVKVAELDIYYYPDLSMTCEPFIRSAKFVTQPRLVVEILSPSTETIDRREKMIAYRTIKSLVEYVIVHQDKALIEVYKKNAAPGWTLTEFANSDSLRLDSLPEALPIPLQDIYEGLDFAVQDA
jgi:Uma2 family endonuclease